MMVYISLCLRSEMYSLFIVLFKPNHWLYDLNDYNPREIKSRCVSVFIRENSIF